MSKRLWNAFYRMLPVSLLETAQPCIENASMDIVIEERMRDGSARDIRRMRHVKVCHSQNECCYYDVPIDPATGIGKITISDIQAVQHVIVQTDESGQQMINGDEVDITYLVDEEIQQEDYATVIYTSTTSHRTVRIINQQLGETQLHVVKKLVDMNGDPLEFQRDMAFTLHVMQNGQEQCVTLDASNDRYMNDEQIAQAVAGYLEKVGIKVNLNLMPKSNFFTYIKPAENKSMLLQTGWSDASGDGLSLLHDMLRTYNREAGQGTVNRGHYSNPEVDALISQAFTEFDDAKRGELVAEADKIARDDYAYIPLHFARAG